MRFSKATKNTSDGASKHRGVERRRGTAELGSLVMRGAYPPGLPAVSELESRVPPQKQVTLLKMRLSTFLI
jgi:hypothetical protein